MIPAIIPTYLSYPLTHKRNKLQSDYVLSAIIIIIIITNHKYTFKYFSFAFDNSFVYRKLTVERTA
jgi:hypothetical protein